MNHIEIIRFFEEKYPTDLAYDWDNVGLQVGSLNTKAKRVLITLDVTKNVVKEAIKEDVGLIISHHPLMFKPIKNILFDAPNGWMLKHLIQKNIAVYAAHTNFDQAEGGMNDILGNAIGIKSPKLLDEIDNIGRFGAVEEQSLDDFIKHLKNVFLLDTVKVIRNKKNQIIRNVGISGGSGSHHMYAAKKRNCDVYITGDITYHTALDAKSLGMTLIDVGHHVEVIFIKAVKAMLEKQFPDVTFLASTVDTNPYEHR